MNKTTPTPRTNEVERKHGLAWFGLRDELGRYQDGMVRFRELARQLERELAAERRGAETLAVEVLGQERFDNSPCQAHALELVSEEVKKLKSDLAAAREELRAIGDHVGGGAFYRNEHGGRLPLRDQVGQHIAELNQQLAAAREVLASKDTELASVKAHAEAMRDWIRVREWTTAEPIALVVAYDRAAHLKDAP